jgi:hypothetical protein
MISIIYLSMWMTSYLSVTTLTWYLITLLSSKFTLHDLGDAHYFLGIESCLLVWVSCLVNTSMLLIFWVVRVCHHVNPLTHQLLFPKLICSLLSYFRITFASAKLLVLYSISPLLDQTSVMLWTRYVIFMLLPKAIGLPLNVYCDTWKVRPPLVSTLLVTLPYLYMVLLMSIRPKVLMIGNPRVDTLSFLATLPFYENLASNALLLAPLLKQSIRP